MSVSSSTRRSKPSVPALRGPSDLLPPDAMKLDPDDPGPTHASLDEQALFLLGYHHQRAHTNAARVAAAAAKGTDKGRAASSVPADVQS